MFAVWERGCYLVSGTRLLLDAANEKLAAMFLAMLVTLRGTRERSKRYLGQTYFAGLAGCLEKRRYTERNVDPLNSFESRGDGISRSGTVADRSRAV
jgi:hypothetical protein